MKSQTCLYSFDKGVHFQHIAQLEVEFDQIFDWQGQGATTS